jgi:hypothetical protein
MRISVDETKQILEKEKVILGGLAIINWTKSNEEGTVTAIIDMKVTPKRGVCFD